MGGGCGDGGALAMSLGDFLAMGGYGFYVWSAYGITALAIVVELASLRARARAAEKLARMDKR